jgi:hypothetical protein
MPSALGVSKGGTREQNMRPADIVVGVTPPAACVSKRRRGISLRVALLQDRGSGGKWKLPTLKHTHARACQDLRLPERQNRVAPRRPQMARKKHLVQMRLCGPGNGGCVG